MADIGCSAGFISDELAEAGAAQVAGIDIDIPCLGKAQERFGKRISFVCGDGERLPFPTETSTRSCSITYTNMWLTRTRW